MDELRSRWTLCVLSSLCVSHGCAVEPQHEGGEQLPPPGAPAVAGAPAMVPAPLPMAGAAAVPPTTTEAPPAAPSTMPMVPPPAEPTAPTEPLPPTDPEDMLPWQPLISAPWELAANEETTYCQRVTLTEDVYFRAIRALNPLGTHHTATTVGEGDGSLVRPDGLTRDCGSALSPQGIFGSGVGTDSVIYPPGVGMHLRAGQQVLLNLHVYNSSAAPLSGTSGTEIVVAQPGEIQHVAESLLAGPTFFSLPPGTTTKVSGQCTVVEPSTLFAVQPHMHKLGVHMKGVAQTAARGEVVLHDGPFDFETQIVVEIEPLPMEPGDVVDVECTFDNTTDRTVTLGESSDTEMCFLVLHRYPAAETPNVLCTR